MTYLTEQLLALTLTLAHFTPVSTTPTQLATTFFLTKKEATSELHLLLLLHSLGVKLQVLLVSVTLTGGAILAASAGQTALLLLVRSLLEAVQQLEAWSASLGLCEPFATLLATRHCLSLSCQLRLLGVYSASTRTCIYLSATPSFLKRLLHQLDC